MSKWFIPLLCFLTLSTAHANPPEDLYEKAILTSPLVKQMHEEGVERRTRESQELQSLLDFIASKNEMSFQAYEDTKGRVENWLHRRGQDVYGLDQLFDGHDRRVFDHIQSSFIEQPLAQFINNRMGSGLNYAEELFEENFGATMDGQLPEGLSIAPPKMNTAESLIYATNQGVALKHLLLATTSVLGDFDKLSGLSQVKGFNPSDSVFIHNLPFPQSKFNWHDDFDRSFYGEKGFTVVHNGYGFEGQKGEATQKRFGPHNAASLLEKHIGKLPAFFTSDPATYQFIPNGGPSNYYTHPRIVDPLFRNSIFCWKWRGGIFPVETYRSLNGEHLRSNPFISEIEKVEPGMVYQTCFQTEKREPFMDKAAHAGVVIGTQGHGPDAQVFVMGARRAFSKNGYIKNYVYGVESFEFQTAFIDQPYDNNHNLTYREMEKPHISF